MIAEVELQQVGHLSYIRMFQYIQESQECEEENATKRADAYPHVARNDECVAVAWLVVHHLLRWWQRGQCHCCKSIHNEIYPQHLRNRERTLCSHESTCQDNEARYNVYGKLEKNETLYVLIQTAPPHDGTADGKERIVDDCNVGSLFGNTRSVAHRESDVSGFQRRGVVCAVARNGYYLVERLQALHQTLFVHWLCACYNL